MSRRRANAPLNWRVKWPNYGMMMMMLRCALTCVYSGQVAALQLEVKKKEEHVQQFVAISEAAEAAHKELQTTYDQYKLLMESKLKASQVLYLMHVRMCIGDNY